MKIHVCGLAYVDELVERERPSRVVSLLAPEDRFPTVDAPHVDAHHKVAIHDIREVLPDQTPPMQGHVEEVISFLGDWDPQTPLLIHCWAGISRSTATAFTAACMHNPEADEAEIARALRTASPTAYPNTRIIAFADDILGRSGRMLAAIEAMGRGAISDTAEPFHLPARFAAA